MLQNRFAHSAGPGKETQHCELGAASSTFCKRQTLFGYPPSTPLCLIRVIPVSLLPSGGNFELPFLLHGGSFVVTVHFSALPSGSNSYVSLLPGGGNFYFRCYRVVVTTFLEGSFRWICGDGGAY